MALSDQQLERYARQIILKGFGIEGQQRLLASSVLIIGAGGLGSAMAQYLAAAGIGRIGLVDKDVVELSNLQRQILHYTPDVGQRKVDSASKKIKQLNPDVHVDLYPVCVRADNILGIIKPYDFILDAVDNFAGKFLINDACVLAGKPFCHAGISGWDGQLFTYLPDGHSACYRCLFKAPPIQDVGPDCKPNSVLGAVAGVIGLLQAEEAIKYFLQQGTLLTNRLLIHQGQQARFREMAFQRQADCPICGGHPTILEVQDEGPVPAG